MDIQNFTLKPLYVVKDILRPEWSWVSNTNCWTGFHLWYLFQNSVTIQTETREYHLSPGDTFLFDLSQNHYCTHDPSKPAGMFTAFFYCDQAPELQAFLREGVILHKNHPLHFQTNMELFEEAVRSSNTPEETELWLAPIFHQLFSPASSLPHKSKILELCRMIDAQPQNAYSLSQLAHQIGYSQNQLIRLFRQATGFTPHDYMIHARITKAKHLLLFSDYSATQIANQLGYCDLNHFSSQFFKKTGCYPSEYAKLQKDGCTQKQ